ncbi:serine/threonine protein kinase [Kribbella pittospori]|uniref:non-specific serine/threonine protein kinase n=1 Tax=Kribbella pittospori TaxID=722689 RepID=A0A4R0KVG3_9ACTN|nr:serine/threonine-protein kinase [Kribbella pittospori]TCC64530.1 serine/threonine protein kinase [Kribbella pittospori]
MLVAERYRLGASMGRGGMGEVFRGTDEQLGRPVAVKLLLPSDKDPRAAERFHREARAAARLNDPHVVAVYDFGNHGDGFFLAMELVEGGSVADELAEKGPLPKDRAIDLIEQSAAGLAAAHEQDVVHRDVKPSNLLLTTEGTVKVADFGIAHVPEEGASTLTGTGQIIGSVHYLAPERARGERSGKPADVYALGCVLYQLVTGRPPFTADHPTAILYQHVDASPGQPSLIRPELGGSFEIGLLGMLSKDPADRPSAEEVAGGYLRTASVGTAAPAGPETTSPLEPLPPPPPNHKRRNALLIGLIAALATAAAVMAGFILNGNDTPPPTTDVGPQTTPSTARPSPTTTDPSRSATENQQSQTTKTQPTRSPSPSRTPSETPSTTPSETPSPTEPTQTSTTSEPTQSTPTSPSNTPPPETNSPSTQPSGTPPPPGAE